MRQNHHALPQATQLRRNSDLKRNFRPIFYLSIQNLEEFYHIALLGIAQLNLMM